MTFLDFFKSNILPQAIASGCFGENPEVVNIVEDQRQGKDQFASSVQFLAIEVAANGALHKFPLVCKVQCDSAERRDLLRTDLQFYNEVLFYKEIVPLLPISVLKLLPKFYFGVATLNEVPEDDVIIVEDLTADGYELSTERLFLDFEHCSLIFRKLGEFHGASLQLKSKSQLKFANKINKLAETRWIDTSKDYLNHFIGESSKRGIIQLLKSGEHPEILNRFLDRVVDIYSLVNDILQTNEYSVLCHGDFCRNNMVFKYEETRPVDVKFYDLATARYASPVIDISFFLFLNTTSDFRQKYFKDHLLKTYLEALQNIAGTEAPTMTKLWEEFQEKAVYGYIVTAFFLPIMMDDQPKNLDDRFKNLTLEERVKLNLARGGQKVTDMLSDSVKDLITWGCLK